MENNCLVKRLNVNVNNDNLERFGMLRVHINAATAYSSYNSARIQLGGIGEIDVELTNGKNMYAWTNASTLGENYGSKHTFTNTANLVLPDAGEYDVFISSKVSQLSIVLLHDSATLNLDKLYYTKISTLGSSNATTRSTYAGNIANLPDTLENFYIIYSSLINTPSGDVKDLVHTSLKNIKIQKTTGIYGSIDELGKLGLTSLNIMQTSVSGTIEGFVRNMVNAGITTKSMNMDYIGSNNHIKYNGVDVPGGTATFAWEPSQTAGKTVITLNGGTPVEIDN